MSSGDKLFGRLLNRHPPPDALATRSPQSVGLQMHLNAEGRVIHLTGPLRHVLAQQTPTAQIPHLLDFLLPHSSLVVDGSPAEWLGQSLDLDFYSLSGQPLHLRGWVQPLADAWLLQLLDIGDLLLERRQSRSREQCQLLATQMGEQLRLCSLARLPEVLMEQLQGLAQRYQIPCIAVALLDEQEEGWQIHQHYAASGAPELWQIGQRLGTGLDSLSGSAPQLLSPGQHPRLQGTFGHSEGFAVPYHDAQGVVAWLLCGIYPVQQRAPDLSERDWLQLTAALAAPLLERLREHRHHLQLERLESLQSLLGTGWWEVFSDSGEVQLAPSLASTLNLLSARLPLQDWLDQVHPADRDELNSRLQDLQDDGTPLLLCVRLAQAPIWYRLQGQALGIGKNRRLAGFMLDITEATLAAEQVKQSEERYRSLVEDSPAMICRYCPDLTLSFGNRPLATYLECRPEQLPGVNLGSWMTQEQRETFLQRLSQLSPEFPVSTAQINLQLPGRERAWWVWSDRGVFDAQGRLLEVQAVGHVNPEVRQA